MSTALYRKYRSRTLDEVAGQKHVTTLLSNALKSGQTAHAYLFTGPRGVGKTSIARIMAHEVNGLPYDEESTHLDIIEIDAASNNGVEDIRDLRDRVQIAPVSAKRKVYIIDEVHMLSKAAFNALLKTLEEPPEHVVFILATTDIDKVPETIISRTQRHTFRRASDADIIANLKRIAQGEGVSADEDALLLIAKHADGSFRDSVSLFDQLISGMSGTSLGVADVTASLGLVSSDVIGKLLDAAKTGDVGSINAILAELEGQGVPARTTAAQLADRLRKEVSEQPGLMGLLDGLLDVSRSHYPELKLLTTLGLYSRPVPEGTTVPQPSPGPTAPKASPPTTKAKAVNAPAKKTPATPTPVEEPEEAVAESAPSEPRILAEPSGPFDWDALVAHVRKNHVALHSVLSKCDHELDGDTLRLYTKSAFYKKKLDDLKYKTLLVDSLTEMGYGFDIDIVSTAKPMNDSQLDQVAAMMGGGEEVSVEDA